MNKHPRRKFTSAFKAKVALEAIKYGYIHLNPYKNATELIKGIDHYIRYYNARTHHSTKQSPNIRYNDKTTQIAA